MQREVSELEEQLDTKRKELTKFQEAVKLMEAG